ncbi:hypothetical protein ACIPM2_10665 [Streptomyces sp. NPDC086081]
MRSRRVSAEGATAGVGDDGPLGARTASTDIKGTAPPSTWPAGH